MIIALVWLWLHWGLSVLLALWGTWRALEHLSEAPPHLDQCFNLFPVTVLKPLKGVEDGLEENLRTFFALDYPCYELIFSVADPRDPARAVVERLIREHRRVPARLLIGSGGPGGPGPRGSETGHVAGPNPKVNNLVTAYEQARYDWLLISDSNVRVSPSYLKRLVAHLELGVGLITSIVAGCEAQGIGGELEATFLNTFYARGMAVAFGVGRPCVVGKSMMLRKSTAERFGGIAVLARYLAEDFIAGQAVRQLGLRVILAHDPIRQHIGEYTMRQFWLRHIRWGRIRKAQAPAVFALEPLLGAMLSGLSGATVLSHTWGVPWWLALATHLGLWMGCDLMLMARLEGRRPGARAPLLWLARELLCLPLWAQAAAGSTVCWRGQELTLQRGGLIET